MRKVLKQRAGFTMIELSIVILVIAILIGAGAFGYSKMQQTSRESVAKQECSLLAKSCTLIIAKEPAKFQNADGQKLKEAILAGGYISKKEWVKADDVRDPWGNPYNISRAVKGHGTVTCTNNGESDISKQVVETF